MQISLSDTGKRFNRDWIFRHLSYEFSAGNSYAITGPNGSGKSTLLQVIAGAVMSSEGSIVATVYGKTISPESLFRHIAIAAPYQELIEEMSLKEFLSFHDRFKPFLHTLPIDNIIRIIGLEAAAEKQMRHFSSGMKQRVKLAQAILSNVQCVLLDEPCTNLDSAGIALYNHLVSEYCSDRLVIVSSNDPQEYSFCKHVLEVTRFKGS